MKSLILLFFTGLIAGKSIAQESYDSSYRFYYYDQKLSMFLTMPDQKDEVVWLGDSITDGCEWAELFPTVNTLNRGISSDNTFGILHRLYEVTKRKPRKVFILIGINDIARNIPSRVILGNYAKIIAQIKAESPATQIIVQSLLPTNSDFTNFKNHQGKDRMIWEVNMGLRELATKEQTDFLDLTSPFMDKEGKLDKKYTNDGLHLTGEGYALWKKLITDAKLL